MREEAYCYFYASSDFIEKALDFIGYDLNKDELSDLACFGWLGSVSIIL